MAAECFSFTSTTFADTCRMLSLCQGLTGVAMSKRTSHHSVDFRKTIATCTGSTASFAEASFVVFGFGQSAWNCWKTLAGIMRMDAYEVWMDHDWYWMDGQVFHPSFMDVQRSSLCWWICVPQLKCLWYRECVWTPTRPGIQRLMGLGRADAGNGWQWKASQQISLIFFFGLGRFKARIN